MAITAHNITNKLDIVKPLQWVGEGDSEATTTLYGATPSSATFVPVGNNTELAIQRDVAHADIMGLGSEDLLDAILTGRAYTFNIKYNPIQTDLLKFIWDASAAGTVNPRESISFTYSYNLDGTEYFTHLRGARPVSATWSVQRGVWEAEMSFVCKDITIPNSTDGNGGTPVYVSVETSSAAIDHTTAGGSPLTIGGNPYAERRFSITVTRGISIEDVNGEVDIVYSKLNDRRITWSSDIFIGTTGQITTLETALEAKTKLAMAYKIDGTDTFTTANNVLTSYNEVPSASNTDAIIASVSGRAESATDLA